MRVLVDGQIFTMQTRGGISRYFVELMKHISANPSSDIEIVQPLNWTRNTHAVENGLGKPLPKAIGSVGRLQRTVNLWQGLRLSCDIVHHTYYHPRYLRLKPDVLRVVTVYDMIPEVFPELFPQGNPHASKWDFVKAADLIFCISTSTKTDLINHFGVPKGRVVVTPLGVDDLFRPGASRVPDLPPSYVLFVGERKAYKDFKVLIDACAKFSPRFNDTWIVAVGGGAFTADERRSLSAAGLGGRAMQVDLTDSDLNRAYANARAFVFPSRYEGFGLPTLEAMASGCPVVLADSSSHPEVGGSAALYFPPGDSKALARTLDNLLDDTGLVAKLGDAGVARARGFRWSESCSRTVDEYRMSCEYAQKTRAEGKAEGRK